MRQRLPKSLLLALLTTALLAPAAAFAQRGERVMTSGFDVSPGGTLEVAVHDADVSLTAGSDDRVEVEVYLDARDMDRGRERFERMNFRASLHGNTVQVESDREDSGWSWRDLGHFNVRVEVRLPERFDVDVRTEDGDVGADRLQGSIVLASEDGDVSARRLAGEVRIETADGDIRVDEIRGGRVDIRTSDGDLDLGTVSAERIDLRTSDGDIRVDVADADDVEAHTSDGDVALRGIRGSLTASTQDGDVDVDVDQAGEIALQTGDGDVTLSLPENAAVDLDARGEDVALRDGAGFHGSVGNHRIDGQLNGGGPRVRVRTGDGRIVLRLRAS